MSFQSNVLNEWDNSSKAYTDLRLKGLDSYEELVNYPSIKRLLGNLKGKKLLDAGCGTGEFTYMLGKEGADAVGCDGAKQLINICKENFPKTKFEVCDLTKKLKYKNDSFDLILNKYVLMFLEKPEFVLKEFKRILKKDGKLVISIAHPTYWLHYWMSGYWGLKKREGFSDMEGYFKIKKFSFSIKGDKNLKFTFIHRPLNYYLNLFIREGFVIDEIDEPIPNKLFLKKEPDTITNFVPKALNIKLSVK